MGPPEPIRLVGKFDNHNETLTGEIRRLSDRFLITLRTDRSKLYCEGVGQITYTPPIRVPYVCAGNGGIAVLQCGSSRRLTVDWRSNACGRGEATGIDNTGARFSFVYGLPEAEAQQYLTSAQAELAGKPGLDQASVSGGSGTGFLISSDGLVVTNHHVIEGARTIEVHQGRVIYLASIVARDAANDLAVLKTEMKGNPLPIASARASMRGDEVMTLGYPLPEIEGESQRATFGRVNATTGLMDDARYLQIDVPIQPGNSGGPLLNKRGEVIGVVSSSLGEIWALQRTGALPQNVNYAVKADYVMVLFPPSAQPAALAPAQEMDLAELVSQVENSVVRIISKP
jgi:S1-C subfamily serine protease